MSAPYSQQSRRAVYRVVYPPEERPRFQVGTDVMEVLDCSELGLRYEGVAEHAPAVGGTVDGVVRFPRGVEVTVTGEVVRVQGRTVALWFRTLALSFTVVVAEQEYLRGKGYSLSDSA